MLFPLHKWRSLRFRSILFSWQCLVCCNVGGFLLTMLNPTFSHYMVVSTMPLMFGSFFYVFYYCKEKPWGLYIATLTCFGLAFTSWIVDKTACDEATKFFEGTIGFYPQLHAFWHIFITATLWCAIMLGVSMRLTGDKKNSKMLFVGVVPMIDLI